MNRFAALCIIAIWSTVSSGLIAGCRRGNPAGEVADTATAESHRADAVTRDVPATTAIPPTEIVMGTGERPARHAGAADGSANVQRDPLTIGPGHFQGHREDVVIGVPEDRELTVTPDGRFAISVRRRNRNRASIQVWELAAGRLLGMFHEPMGVSALAVSPDGSTLAYGAGDASVVLQPLPMGAAERWGGHSQSVGALAFSPDGERLVSYGNDRRLLLWEIGSGKSNAVDVDPQAGFAADVQFAGADRLWTRSSDHALRWYDVQGSTLTLNKVIRVPDDLLVLSSQGETLYGVQRSRTFAAIDAETGLPVPDWGPNSSGAPSGIRALAVVRATREIIASTNDQRLFRWKAGETEAPSPWSGDWPIIRALAVDPTGRYVVAATTSGGVVAIDRNQQDSRQWLEQERTLEPHSPARTRFSADGTHLGSARSSETVSLVDLATGIPSPPLTRPLNEGPAGAPEITALEPVSRSALYCGTAAGTLEVFPVDGAQQAATIPVSDAAISTIAASADGALVVIGTANGRLFWIDRDQATPHEVSTGAPSRPILAADVAPDARTVAIADESGAIVLWDVARRSPRLTCRGHDSAVRTVCFDGFGRQLVSGDERGKVVLWDAQTGAQTWSLTMRDALVQMPVDSRTSQTQVGGLSPGEAQSGSDERSDQFGSRRRATGIAASAFSRDGLILAVGTSSGYSQTFDLVNRRELSPVYNGLPVEDLEFDERGASLLVAVAGGNVYRWWRSPAPPQTFAGHRGSVRFVALDAGGTRAVSGGVDKTLKIWNVDHGELLHTLDNEGEVIAAGAISPDGRHAVTCGYGSGITFWDLTAPARLAKRYGHAKRSWAVSLSPDGNRVASGSDDSTVRVWDFASQKTLQILKHSHPVRFVAYSPDGAQLVTATLDPRGWQYAAELQIWDPGTGRTLRSLPGHRAAVTGACYSADSRTLFTCSADGTVCCWNAASGDLIRSEFRPHGLSHAGMISNGPRLVLRRFNDGVFVDDARSLARLAEFDAPTRQITDLAVAQCGSRIVAGSDEGVLYMWSLGDE